MSLKKLHVIVAVVGIAGAGALAWWWQHQGPGAPGLATASSRAPGTAPAASAPGAGGARAPGIAGSVTVEVGRVETMRLEDEAAAVGSLRSRQGVMLRPEVSGRIVELGFRDGQRVRKGQTLVQLDDTLQRAQLQQARAQASIARTTLQRNRELVAQNFVSQSAVDQSAATLEVAESQVALAQAQLGRMRILAPFDGVAGIRLVNVGDYVRDGADMVNIEDMGAMLVDFRLPERVLSRLRTGQDVAITLDGLPGRQFPAHIEAVDSQLDANGRSLLVRARLDNPDGALRPGMFARARIVFATREAALVVPEEALVPQGGRQFLVKVVEGPNGPQGRRLEARIGLRVPGKVEILDGLRAGDAVVVAGQGPLLARDGLDLRIVDIGMPGGGAAGMPAAAAASAAPAAPSGSAPPTPVRPGV